MVDNSLSQRRTHERWFPVLALVAVATMINYLDRTVLGIAAPYLTKELGLTAAAMGVVFSAFSWSYALLQIPGGIFLDRFGTRVTYSLALTLWSAFTALMGLVTSLPTLVLTRIGVGVFEAPCFPANSRILATWFPQHERARANSIYSVGQYAGIAFLSVPLFWVTQQFGWRGLFFIAGGFGIVLGLLFWWRYREPSESATVSAAELADIEAGGGGEYKGERVAFSWRNIGLLLRHRQIVGASIGQFGGNSTQVFFVTWFPTYLVNARGMDFINAGMMAMLPYIGASVGVLVAGQVSDRLLKRTGSANLARKLPIVGGMLMASDDRRGELRPGGREPAGRRHHVGSLLRSGHDQSRLDGDFRRRPEETHRAHGRHLQLQREPGGNRHPAGHRLHLSVHRLVRWSAGVHRRGGTARRVRVQRHPGRYPPSRGGDDCSNRRSAMTKNGMAQAASIAQVAQADW